MKTPLVAAAVLAAVLAAPAHADTFLFHQGGYADGARVSGWFQGEDADHDGWIFPYETTNFSLSFSGNSIVGAFTHSMANGAGGGVTYQLGSGEFTKYPYGGFITMGGLGDNQTLDSIRFASWEWEAEYLPGAVTDLHRLVTTFSENPLRVTEVSAVPEPGNWALLSGGLAAIGALVRRRTRTA